jgi:hypothetical protein
VEETNSSRRVRRLGRKFRIVETGQEKRRPECTR